MLPHPPFPVSYSHFVGSGKPVPLKLSSQTKFHWAKALVVIKTLSVKININRTTDIIEPLDFDSFTLLDDSKNLRIRPSGVYYLKSDKKKYLKSKSVNNNYNSFNETIIEGYENFEAQSYNTNFLGLKKKNSKASIKSLKKVTIKTKKTSYFIDFPVLEGFIYGKIYYKNKPIGFAAVKN